MLSSVAIPKSKFRNSLDMSTINPHVLNTEYSVHGPIDHESYKIFKQMQSGQQFPFEDLIACNIGNPFAVGKPPLTFPRQVLAGCELSSLLTGEALPQEARERAKEFLASTHGGLGAYSAAQGYKYVRNDVAKFISERDGVSCDPRHIFLTMGATQCVSYLMRCLISNPNVGILTPYPTYPLYTAEVVLNNGHVVPYYLKESDGWSLDFEALQESIVVGRDQDIDLRALVVINPGNPTGSVLNADQIRKCIKFCEANNLLLIADEVYQSCILNEHKNFVSFKKIAAEMHSRVQLVSLHSISKGFYGECGHRGGYMELYNIPEAIENQILKIANVNLCPPTPGQLLVDLMVRPPTGECKATWDEETAMEIEKMKDRATRLTQRLSTLPGIKCQPADGAMYLFPSLDLPLKAYEEANAFRINGNPVEPDTFWSIKLLRSTGIQVVPGSAFGQVPGTQHFRITFLPFAEKMDAVIERITSFQTKFMEQYS